MDLIILVRHKKRNMECVMDLSCLGEAELICDQRKDLDNHEGSFMFWSKFQVGDGSF